MKLRQIDVDNLTERMSVICACPVCKEPSLIFLIDLKKIEPMESECCNQIRFLSRSRALDFYTEYQMRIIGHAKIL